MISVTLQEALYKQGKSQYWLAKHTGITPSTINKLCNNKTSRIDFDTIDKICISLNCNIADILRFDKGDE